MHKDLGLQDTTQQLLRNAIKSLDYKQVNYSTYNLQNLQKNQSYIHSLINLLSCEDNLIDRYSFHQLIMKESINQKNVRKVLMTRLSIYVSDNVYKKQRTINKIDKAILKQNLLNIIIVNWSQENYMQIRYLVQLICRWFKNIDWFKQNCDRIIQSLQIESTKNEVKIALTIVNGLLSGFTYEHNFSHRQSYEYITQSFLQAIQSYSLKNIENLDTFQILKILDFILQVLNGWKLFYLSFTYNIPESLSHLRQLKGFFDFYSLVLRKHKNRDIMQKIYIVVIVFQKLLKQLQNKIQQTQYDSFYSQIWSGSATLFFQTILHSFLNSNLEIAKQLKIPLIIIFYRVQQIAKNEQILKKIKNKTLSIIRQCYQSNYIQEVVCQIIKQIHWFYRDQQKLFLPVHKLAAYLWIQICRFQKYQRQNQLKSDHIYFKVQAYRKSLRQVSNSRNGDHRKLIKYTQQIFRNMKKQRIYEQILLQQNLQEICMFQNFGNLQQCMESENIYDKLAAFQIYQTLLLHPKIKYVHIFQRDSPINIMTYILPNLMHQNLQVRRKVLQFLNKCADFWVHDDDYVCQFYPDILKTVFSEESQDQIQQICLISLPNFMQNKTLKKMVLSNICPILRDYKNFIDKFFTQDRTQTVIQSLQLLIRKNYIHLYTCSQMPSIFQELLQIYLRESYDIISINKLYNVLELIICLCQNKDMEKQLRPSINQIFKFYAYNFESVRRQDSKDRLSDKWQSVQETVLLFQKYLCIIKDQNQELVQIYTVLYFAISKLSLDSKQMYEKCLNDQCRNRISIFLGHFLESQQCRTLQELKLWMVPSLIKLMRSFIICTKYIECIKSIYKNQEQKLEFYNKIESRQYRYNQLFRTYVLNENHKNYINFQGMFFKAIRNLYIQIQGGISQRYQVQKLKKIIATNFTNYLTSDNLINHKFYPKESLLCLDDVDSLNILVMQTIKHYLYQFKGMISLQTLKDIWLACCSIFSFIFLIESQQIHIFEYLQQILGILVVENTDLILNLAFQSKSQLNLERLMGILLFQQQKQSSQLSQDYHFTIKQYEILCKIKICCLCEVLMSKYLRQNKWFCDQYLNEIIQTLSCFYEQLRFAKEQQLQFDLYQQIKCKNALNFQRQNLSQYPYTINSLPIKQIIKQSIQKLVDSVLQLSCQTLKIIDELVKYLENPEEYSEEFYQLTI